MRALSGPCRAGVRNGVGAYTGACFEHIDLLANPREAKPDVQRS